MKEPHTGPVRPPAAARDQERAARRLQHDLGRATRTGRRRSRGSSTCWPPRRSGAGRTAGPTCRVRSRLCACRTRPPWRSCWRRSARARAGSPAREGRRHLGRRAAGRGFTAPERGRRAAGGRRHRSRAAALLARRARGRTTESCSASAPRSTPRRASCSAGRAIATDDGSVGHHGFVTELLREELDDDPERRSTPAGRRRCWRPCGRCAPSARCRRSWRWSRGWRAASAPAWAASVPTKNGYVRLCVDGPVVDAAELETAWCRGARD